MSREIELVPSNRAAEVAGSVAVENVSNSLTPALVGGLTTCASGVGNLLPGGPQRRRPTTVPNGSRPTVNSIRSWSS